MQLPKYVYSRLVKIDSPYQQMQSFLSPPPPLPGRLGEMGAHWKGSIVYENVLPYRVHYSEMNLKF